jgi:amino acid transporter
VAVCAYAVANTTVAYLGAPWALTLLGIEPTANRIVVTGMVLVVICALAGMLGVGVLSRAVKLGVGAEAVAMVGIGLALLLAFRDEPFSLFTASFEWNGMLAALAVGGWVFIGFDVVVGAAEETEQAERRLPRAIWIALLGVAGVVMLNAVAIGLSGEGDVTSAVVSSFGDWSDKPFAALVLTAFLACGMAAQALTARTMFSIARDGVLPGSRLLSSVDRRHSPVGATVVTAVVACLGLLLGLNSNAVGTLIAFGTAAIYVQFLLIAAAALVGRWRAPGTAVNLAAVAWLTFETVNIAWPRESIAPPDAPFYQVWAAPLLLAAITVLGVAYLLLAHPRPEGDEHGPDGAVEHARAAAAS